MGLWETLTGRSRVKRPNLDALFGIPSAAITLEAAAGFTATGVGSVCFRGAAGGAFAQVQADVIALIRAAQGFDGGLLCTLVPFQDSSGRRFGLVYLYKQGTFYAFAPQPGGQQKRDNLLEISVRDQLAGELPMEADLGRWLAVWGAPGL